MKHNDQLQMQPKGKGKVDVSRAPATKCTESTARMPVLAQWMWRWTPTGWWGTGRPHSVLVCFQDYHVCLTVIADIFIVSETHIFFTHIDFSSTWVRFSFSANFACPHQVWSKNKNQPKIHTDSENKSRTAQIVEHGVCIWVSHQESLDLKQKGPIPHWRSHLWSSC